MVQLVNYVDYKHSYAHALAPILKKLNYHVNVGKKPVQYIKKIITNTLKNPEIKFTEKEQNFFDTVCAIDDSRQLYYFCRNSVNKAKETFVYVDSDGELLSFR